MIGTSLTVFSGYRFVVRAKERGLPIAVVNLGPTRADATVKLEAKAGELIPSLVAHLRREAGTRRDKNCLLREPLDAAVLTMMRLFRVALEWAVEHFSVLLPGGLHELPMSVKR